MEVTSQARSYDREHPADKAYVENVMWEQSDVLFVTVNIPGGSNNDTDPWFGNPITAAQTQEVAERTAADIRWLDAAFAQARRHKDVAVVIQTQADMWDADGKAPSHLQAYAPLVDTIATLTASFAKPVLLFNGDSHEYRSDNPLSPGFTLSNPVGRRCGRGRAPLPGLRRAELPPRRRPRQHDPAGVAAADGEPVGERPGERERLRAVQLDPGDRGLAEPSRDLVHPGPAWMVGAVEAPV